MRLHADPVREECISTAGFRTTTARHIPWPEARRRAADAGKELPGAYVDLSEAVGLILAAPLVARTDLPAFDVSAMDGWAVAGPGPWRVHREEILAGDHPAPLTSGSARRIATGATVPPGTRAVLRLEEGAVTDGMLRGPASLANGRDIRPRGQECRMGTPLLDSGSLVTPVAAGLAAAAGHDRLLVHRRPRVRLLVTGGEFVPSGTPGQGRVRDALSPLLVPMLRTCGAEFLERGSTGDQDGPLRQGLTASDADVVVTTGGTSRGPTDHLRRVLEELDARLVVDSVAVRPGHPMLLAELSPGSGGTPRWLVGLPGNPLAAVVGLVTIGLPLLRGLLARPQPEAQFLPVAGALTGHPRDTRLVPVRTDSGWATALPFDGAAMLRGAALADAFAVVPPGGGAAGSRLEIIPLAGYQS
jgi:molybdopterin molybdotransferase